MRLIIFLSLFVTLLLAGCGNDSAAPAADAAPTTPSQEASERAQETPSKETPSDETLKQINQVRTQGIEAINRTESLSLMKVVAVPNSTEEQLTKIKTAYEKLRKSVQNYEAETPEDMKKFIESENAKMLESLKR